MMIVIAAGGTGGHLYPAVALAREFLRHDPTNRLLFVGTARGIEAKVLGHEGFELALVAAKPVMGKGLRGIVQGVWAIPMGIWQSLGILRRYRADLVIGVGGYTSPAMVIAAALRGIRRVILEPNAHPGMANTALAPLAQRIFVAFESAAAFFDHRKVRVVGTPIRREFLAESERVPVPPLPSRKTLLIFGGSQGARAINSAVLDGLRLLMTHLPDLSIIHQTGESDYKRVSEAYRTLGIKAQVAPFFYDMPAVLKTADLVVARAGAMTIAELTACGKPAILIPLPTAIYDHQTQNARAMEAAGGAILVAQVDLTGAKLSELIGVILQDQQRLETMRSKSWEMRRMNAADAIVRECYALMGVRYDSDRTVGATGA